jgi:hypothetical protein
LKSRIGVGLVYAGSLAAGWKNRRGITVAKNGALGSLVPKVSALTMLVALVSLCLALPAAACLGDRGANLAWSHQDQILQRQLARWEDLSAAKPSCISVYQEEPEGTLRIQSDPPDSHESEFEDEPVSTSEECGGMFRGERPGTYLVTLVIIATFMMAFLAAMAATVVMAVSAAIGATMNPKGAAQIQSPKSAGFSSRGPGTGPDIRARSHHITWRNGHRCHRGQNSNGMNRWSTPGVVRNIEQQTGEYGVDWDEWGPIPCVLEGPDLEANAPPPPGLDTGSNGGAGDQQEDYVYPGRLPEEDEAWVEWFRENGVHVGTASSNGSSDEDSRRGPPSDAVASRPE